MGNGKAVPLGLKGFTNAIGLMVFSMRNPYLSALGKDLIFEGLIRKTVL